MMPTTKSSCCGCIKETIQVPDYARIQAAAEDLRRQALADLDLAYVRVLTEETPGKSEISPLCARVSYVAAMAAHELGLREKRRAYVNQAHKFDPNWISALILHVTQLQPRVYAMVTASTSVAVSTTAIASSSSRATVKVSPSSEV